MAFGIPDIEPQVLPDGVVHCPEWRSPDWWDFVDPESMANSDSPACVRCGEPVEGIESSVPGDDSEEYPDFCDHCVSQWPLLGEEYGEEEEYLTPEERLDRALPWHTVYAGQLEGGEPICPIFPGLPDEHRDRIPRGLEEVGQRRGMDAALELAQFDIAWRAADPRGIPWSLACSVLEIKLWELSGLSENLVVTRWMSGGAAEKGVLRSLLHQETLPEGTRELLAELIHAEASPLPDGVSPAYAALHWTRRRRLESDVPTEWLDEVLSTDEFAPRPIPHRAS